MRLSGVAAACVAVLFVVVPAVAQDSGGAQAPTPAPPSSQLPPVDVIQKKATPAPTAQKKVSPKKKTAVSPAPQPPPPVAVAPVDNTPVGTQDLPYYGPSGGRAAAARVESGPSSPINPNNGILPGDLTGFPSAGDRIATEQVDEFHPRTTNDVFNRVPGVHVVNDDGFGRHGGIGIRGSPPRRGRKVLVMEDGISINMSLWLDPSVHYVPPLDRIDSTEVLRGTVMAYGPNNNHGVVNFKNFSPFGANETVISSAIGYTENDDGSFTNEDDEVFGSIIERSDVSSQWHIHTRQMSGNVGAVMSYSGADVEGAWDTERLRYNDLYGALGWKGVDQDLVVSGVYFRQRDHYDEANVEGEEEPGEPSADELFREVAHCKSCINPGSIFNTYNADVVKLQLAHNYYLDDDTTITSRVYGQYHMRDRYQNFEGGDPADADGNLAPRIVDLNGEPVALIAEGSMLGRLRTYKFFGTEVRGELANRNFAAGMTQDIQLGARYEHHIFTNRNFFGNQGQVLDEGDTEGLTLFNRRYTADAFSAFVQTAIHVTRDFTVTPGVRLEHYRVDRDTFALNIEEGEAEEEVDCIDPTLPPGAGGECGVIEIQDEFAASESFTKTNVLPGVALAWTGMYRSTVYGGYHRGLTMHVLREEAFPAKDEIGDNFQLGLRSTALMGVTFDIAAFHNRIQDFQIKGSGIDSVGNNIYSTVDRVEINGFEVYGRLDGRPFTGGPFNPFFEGTYTLSHGQIKEGTTSDDDDPDELVSVAGNSVPEVPRHIAHLTIGLEHITGWDASVSYTYRGQFYTDEANTFFDQEGENGIVPSVWLLSARANYRVPGTNTTLFVAGDNLTNELYISDREDGVKPGQGRTVWGGMKIKLQ
jgi:Fe(3+) dicitrate transport protein